MSVSLGSVAELSPHELAHSLRSEDPPQLVDCRSLREVTIARLPASIHIPLDDLAARHAELDPGRPVVLYCHIGERSLIGARILQQCGLTHVAHLKGGIDAWAVDIDPDMQRYH